MKHVICFNLPMTERIPLSYLKVKSGNVETASLNKTVKRRPRKMSSINMKIFNVCYNKVKDTPVFHEVNDEHTEIPEYKGKCHRELNGYKLCEGCQK